MVGIQLFHNVDVIIVVVVVVIIIIMSVFLERLFM